MNEERIQKLANRLPQGDDSRHASSEELLELCHALLDPSPAPQEAPENEPVSEPYKFRVGDRVWLKNSYRSGVIEEHYPNTCLFGVRFHDGEFNYHNGCILELISPAAQPNPPENPDRWPVAGSTLGIGGVEYARTASHQIGRPDHFVWTGPFFTYVWILTDDQARALRHQITVEQLGQLEGDIVKQVSHSLNTTAHINAAFARLRTRAEGCSK